MSLSYVARLQNQTEYIPFTFSNSGMGMFAIFFNLNVKQLKNIKQSNATLSMVSDFQKTQFYTGLATGIAGSASFVNVVVQGQNITEANTTSTSTVSVSPFLQDFGFTSNPPPLLPILPFLSWVVSTNGGRLLTVLSLLIPIVYYTWRYTQDRKGKWVQMSNEKLKKENHETWKMTKRIHDKIFSDEKQE
jgi:hypothetical protein